MRHVLFRYRRLLPRWRFIFLPFHLPLTRRKVFCKNGPHTKPRNLEQNTNTSSVYSAYKTRANRQKTSILTLTVTQVKLLHIQLHCFKTKQNCKQCAEIMRRMDLTSTLSFRLEQCISNIHIHTSVFSIF